MTRPSPADGPAAGGRRADADIAVIGAGPAGLAAAVTAADAGVRVCLIDAEAAVGGQFWRHPAAGDQQARVREAEVAPLHHGLGEYRRLRQRLRAHIAAGVLRYLPRHEVWAVDRDAAGDLAAAGDPATPFVVHAVDAAASGGPAVTVTVGALVLATGAYDLQIPFPGWDLPGVMTAGGVQSLLKGHAVLAGRRVVVAGTGPFLLSVAAGLLRSGATVPAVVEAVRPAAWLRRPRAVIGAAGKLVEAAGYLATLVRNRTARYDGWQVIAAEGTDRLREVVIAPIGADGSTRDGSARRIAADVLAVGWGFVPQLELAQQLGCAIAPGASGLPVVVADAAQQSSVPGVYVAGEVCGIGGAALARVEGEIAGLAAVGSRHRDSPGVVPAPLLLGGGKDTAWRARRRAALRRFADALSGVYPVPRRWAAALPDDTLVCRCEEVSAGDIRRAVVQDGARDARTVKHLARAGMGHCQGRICGYATECLIAAALPHGAAAAPAVESRPVAAPISLGVLAAGSDGPALP